ncbi:MAG TPA: hypothetical protein VLD63_11515 [Anaerolineales bacterium]|nr:hypothetical protein [Anaerolineales bacterium]
MTLPWIVILAAAIFFVLRKSGLFEPAAGRRPRPPKDQLPEKTGHESDRLKVFEDFLRKMGDEDRPNKPPRSS